jgi:hypothetical protein
MVSSPKELPGVRILRVEHAAAAKAMGSLIASKGIGSIEYREAEKVQSEAWSKLRDALDLSLDFTKLGHLC